MNEEQAEIFEAVNRAIDAMRVTQRLFGLSDGHVLMTACKALADLNLSPINDDE